MVRVALKLDLSANQITVGGFAVGVVGCYFLAKGFLLGAVLVNVWALLDYVDGEVARRRGIANDFGRFLDNLADIAIASILFVSIGIVASRIAYSWVYVAMGGMIAIVRLYTQVIGYNFWQAKRRHPNQSLQLAGSPNRAVMTIGVSLDNVTGFIMPAIIVGTIFSALDAVLFVWVIVSVVSVTYVFTQAVRKVRNEIHV
ncbi:hypothetical protein LCGC14_2611150 [marine sediment metagenome]|uniref:CDP-alcohol phosphatidyltransferase n=1 Tax=marine sediment metagenome TaxID=412755 RepID=A0A0F9A5U6_9ZZZZ